MLVSVGRIEGPVNNTGIADFRHTADSGFARWHTVTETNLGGVFLCTSAATPALKKTRGAIAYAASNSASRLDAAHPSAANEKAPASHHD